MINSTLPSGDAAAATAASTRSVQACAACKYQRRRCTPDCILAPYFPADNPDQFEAAHNLFGVRNILKTISGLDQIQLYTAISNIIFQSRKRREDPVGGCYRIMLEMQQKIVAAKAKYDRLLQYRNHLLAQIQAMMGPLQGDQAAQPNPISDDPPPTSPQQQQQEQEQQQKYHDDFFGVESSGIVKGPEEEINPPPSSSALPLTGSDLGQNLPHQQNGEGDQDKLMADMLRPTHHNLEEDQNEVFAFDMDPPSSWSALLPTRSDLGQNLPHHQSGEGDHDKLMADMLQSTQDNLEQDQNEAFPMDFDPPPSSSALPPTGSALWQDLPLRESSLMADMLQPTHHNLEQDQNDVFACVLHPPPSSTPLPPTGSNLSQDLPQRENGVGDEDKLTGDTLPPTQHHQPTPLTDAVGLEEDHDDIFTFDFGNVYLPPLDDDILPYLITPECPPLEGVLKQT